MRYCTHCGIEQRDDAKFCCNCGIVLQSVNSEQRSQSDNISQPTSKTLYEQWWEDVHGSKNINLLKIQMEKAYFWYKLSFLGANIAATAVIVALCSYNSFDYKWKAVVVGLLVGGLILLWANRKHCAIVGPKATVFLDAKDGEGPSDLYTCVFGKKGLTIIGTLSSIIALVFFLIYLNDEGIWVALRMSVPMFMITNVLGLVIWTFKFGGALLVIACVAILKYGMNGGFAWVIGSVDGSIVEASLDIQNLDIYKEINTYSTKI